MPYVRIEITDGATYEQKLQLYKETTEMLMRVLNKKPEYTFVVIEEVDNKSWGHMGTSVHEIRMSQAAGGAVPQADRQSVPNEGTNTRMVSCADRTVARRLKPESPIESSDSCSMTIVSSPGTAFAKPK